MMRREREDSGMVLCCHLAIIVPCDWLDTYTLWLLFVLALLLLTEGMP